MAALNRYFSEKLKKDIAEYVNHDGNEKNYFLRFFIKKKVV